MTQVLENPIVIKLKELHDIEQSEARLRDEISKARNEALIGLPASFGYADAEEFVRVLAQTHNVKAFAVRAVRRASVGKRKARITITPEMRKQIIAEFQAKKGKSAIMNRWDISGSTAQMLKKEAGMTR